HNIRYWRMENWLGLGPSASGTVIDDKTGTGCRYTVTPDIGAYL
ncbi:MAG TPA: coproporphyrinogen III oxidase, partial [Treponema sp.]|nr:coproporphyrinogen III oxidase [Treponema sp.]